VFSVSNFTDTIGLGCASLPPGVSCRFSALNLALAPNSTQAVQLTIDTSNPLGGGGSAMNAHPSNRSVSFAGLLLPVCFLFGCIFRRLRAKYFSLLTLALLTFFSATLVTGCTGITQISAAPGTYMIQIFGAGANSNITHFQNVTLTITQ
jgi:hypothetical protein